jgi:DNA-binding transcriptional ArsR family regulator/uncharacterized membrane protein
MNILFKALNDQTRREILELLQEKDMTAGEIAENFHMSFPSISHHLDLLKQAKLVIAEKEGQYVSYSLNTTVVDEIMKWFLQFKSNKILKSIVWFIILIPGIYLAFTWSVMPDTIPLHFDIKGNADRYGNKKELLIPVIILTALSLFVYFLFSNIYRIDPKKYAAENKERLKRIGFAIAVFMSSMNFLIIYSGANGGSRFDIGLVLGGVGLLFAIIGNYMPNMKPNYFAGFRLPWTLENPDNWKKTHALAAKIWFAGGLFIAVVCLLIPSIIAFIVFCTVTLAMIIIPSVYSYRLFKKTKMPNNHNQ